MRKNEMYKCTECKNIFSDDDILSAPSPFIPQFTIYACPHCKEIEQFVCLCDYDDCKGDVVGGIQTEEYGYISICSFHFREHNRHDEDEQEIDFNAS